MFEYNGYHFEPVRKLKESEKKDICTFSKHIRSDRELGICDYNVDWKKHNYSWKDFYSASNDSQLDIFLCVENGKLYVPCEHELFRFEEKEHKLPDFYAALAAVLFCYGYLHAFSHTANAYLFTRIAAPLSCRIM